jgi:hypothetical protein
MMMSIDDLTIGEARKIATMFGETAKSETMQSAQIATIHVLVCTDKRGVVFGETANPSARPVVLTNARMALYWSADVGGVFGLAEKGPTKDCKISAVCPSVMLEGVTAVFSCDLVAVKAWSAAKVQGR